MKKYLAIATIGVVASIALAATGDRLKAPVKVGQGSAVTTQVVFDVGNGSTNPFVQSSSGGTLQLSSDGSHLLSVGTVTGTAATVAGVETLTNKTLTAPVISTISNTGTLTLPTSTDTLVGRATTDTLTNKTLTSPTINSPSVSSLTVSSGGMSVTGAATLNSTGGNVPHGCTVRTAVAGGVGNVTVSCNAGEMATGGGCSLSGSSQFNENNHPVSATPPTQWNCSSSTTTGVTAYAVCCSY